VPVLRLLSYNIRSLRDDAAAVVGMIRSVKPHIVCVQEAPRLLRWRSKCAALARRSGLVVVTGGRPAGANLILSTLDVDVLATRDVLFTKDRCLHQRGAALAVLRFSGAPFALAGTHLDLVAEARLRHVGELGRALSAIAPAGVPTVVAGDVNDLPGSATWTQLTADRLDAWAAVGDGDGFTYSARNPRRRIDGIFTSPGARPISAQVIESPDGRRASDHRPLFVEIELPVVRD
jgi:endonuclease/exonuclease/phosphatase family metal-dependent hydrolase